MSVSRDLWDTLKELAALKARTEDVVRTVERLADMLVSFGDRLSRVEVQQETLRESVRNQILADLKAEIAVLKFAFERSSQVSSSLALPSGLLSGNEEAS